MARRTYRPHIQVSVLVSPHMFPNGFSVRYWKCIGYGYVGSGATPVESYDNWYQKFIGKQL